MNKPLYNSTQQTVKFKIRKNIQGAGDLFGNKLTLKKFFKKVIALELLRSVYMSKTQKKVIFQIFAVYGHSCQLLNPMLVRARVISYISAVRACVQCYDKYEKIGKGYLGI